MSRCTHTHCLLLPCTGRPPFAQAKARREVSKLPAGWKCFYNGQSYKWYALHLHAAVKEMCPCNKADKLRDAVKAAVEGGRKQVRQTRRPSNVQVHSHSRLCLLLPCPGRPPFAQEKRRREWSVGEVEVRAYR